jgi:hypothetical protein
MPRGDGHLTAMAHHLNLLSSEARAPTGSATGLPVASLAGVLALVGLAGIAAFAWNHLTDRRLAAELAASTAAAPALATPKLDTAVVGELERRVQAREAMARALTGNAHSQGVRAPASRWLQALAESGAAGVSVSTVRIEPGPRMTLTGAGVQPADINGFIARLQAHPLTGTAAIGQLEIRRGEPGRDTLSFRLTPPPPEGWLSNDPGQASATVSSAEARPRSLP